MINLTQDAREALEHWFQRNASIWAAEGADATEVREDVTAHLMAEFPDTSKPVDLDDIHGVLNTMGLPAMGTIEADHTIRFAGLPTTHTDKEEPRRRWIVRFSKHITSHIFWITIWPALIIAFELLSNFCGGSFFSPVPTWLHAALVLTACLGGWYHAQSIKNGDTLATPAHTITRYASMVVAGYWSLLMLPVLLIGIAGYGTGVVVSFGIGLLFFPIFILCVLIAGAPFLLGAGLLRKNNKVFPDTPRWLGIAIGLILLLAIEGPSYITRYGVETNSPGIIRNFGSKKILLQMCYEGRMGNRHQTDTSGFLLNIISLKFFNSSAAGGSTIEEKRMMFYRVTGKAFNSVKAPTHLVKNRQRGTDFQFDKDLGGDGVFARVKNLDMSSSRLDGHIDHASGLGYWEWTMEFSNSSTQPKEARMQLLLPPQGVVSRLTLWVNGKPQEAAFSSTEKVTKAYKSVAVERRRDPVLVRWVAPDRVLVQCFPVPAKGTMKIRLGVTAPLSEQEQFFLPRLIEQNFGMSPRGEPLETDFWIQGDTELSMDGLEDQNAEGKWKETHGKLTTKETSNQHLHVQCHGGKRPSRVWTQDPFAPVESRVLIRETSDTPASARHTPETSVVVIDASSGTADWRESIANALDDLQKAGHTLHIVMAAEDTTIFENPPIRDIKFTGGQDNLEALEKGFDLAAKYKARNLIWLHGTQPVKFGSAESLIQRIERGLHIPKLMTVDLTGGPNRILEEISHAIRIHRQSRPAQPSDLTEGLTKLLSPPRTAVKWTTAPEETIPSDARKVWDHLARWNVWREVLDSDRSPAVVKRAALYQLVTPVSGAVVLETQAQYREFGLKQVDPNSVPSIPSIPEPSSALLIMMGASLFLFRRQKAGRVCNLPAG